MLKEKLKITKVYKGMPKQTIPNKGILLIEGVDVLGMTGNWTIQGEVRKSRIIAPSRFLIYCYGRFRSMDISIYKDSQFTCIGLYGNK